jgi:hypothetical protein
MKPIKLADFNQFSEDSFSGNNKKHALSKELFLPVYNTVSSAKCGNAWSRKYLKNVLYKEALRDKEVLRTYDEFKSGVAFSFFAWFIFKIVLQIVLNFVIDNYLED